MGKKTTRIHPRHIPSHIANKTNRALLVGFYILDRIEPFHQPFSQQNYTLQYPYAVHERIPIALCFLLACVFPAGVIALYTMVIDGLFSHHKSSSQTSSGGRRKLSGTYRWKDRLWELNCGILGLLLSEGAAFVITGALKNACGKPRPDIIDRCQPSSTPVYGLSNHTICTQEDHHILKDGFRSFPSGTLSLHSPISYVGDVLTWFYFIGHSSCIFHQSLKTNTIDNR